MKAEIRIKENIIEDYAVIYTKEVTAEVRQLASLIEGYSFKTLITVTHNGRFITLRPDEIFMVRVENEKTVVYSNDKKFSCSKRLYEMEALLGNEFIRISKSTIVNLHSLDYAEVSLGGLMLLVLKNGCKDYVSRRYLSDFKKHLGI